MHNMPALLIRSTVSLILLFAVTRLIGKRQLSQMTFFEYTVGITIGSIAAALAYDLESHYVNGLVAIGVYAVIPFAVSWLSMKSKWFRNFVEGKNTVLIQDGKVLEQNLAKEHLTTDELLEHLRLKNAFQIGDVDFAIMESNGRISVRLKPQLMPLTPKDIHLNVRPHNEPTTVIMDGTLLPKALARIGLDRAWVEQELEKKRLTVDDVYLGQINADKSLYVDLYRDK